jgi:peptide/nickel transport system permease protein
VTALTPAGAPQAPAPADDGPPRRGRRLRPGLVAAVVTLAVVVLAAVAPGVLARRSPTAMDFRAPLQPPSIEHWFGTDESGRDLYTRVVHGARMSLEIGVGAAAVALVLALLLGTLAALGPRSVAAVVDRLVEVLFSFPTLLLALLLVAVLGPSALTQLFAVGVGSAPGYARMVRAQVLSAKGSGYVEAAVGLGHSRSRIVRRHVLPNALRPLVAVFTLAVGQSIVWASSMSFLGLGVAPPASEWGALLDAGRQYIVIAPWLVVVPGAVIVVLALAATVVGRHIQAALEKGDG